MTVNLKTIDEFSEEFYIEMLKEKNILEGLIKSTKKALIHQMVSQNRKRFQTQDFNLDLAYISKRVIAMGFPAYGIRSLYRNPAGDVL